MAASLDSGFAVDWSQMHNDSASHPEGQQLSLSQRGFMSPGGDARLACSQRAGPPALLNMLQSSDACTPAGSPSPPVLSSCLTTECGQALREPNQAEPVLSLPGSNRRPCDTVPPRCCQLGPEGCSAVPGSSRRPEASLRGTRRSAVRGAIAPLAEPNT